MGLHTILTYIMQYTPFCEENQFIESNFHFSVKNSKYGS